MSLSFQQLNNRYPEVLIQEGAQIAEGCRIDEGCEISAETVLSMGTAICKGTRIIGAVEIGRNVIVRENVTLVGPLTIQSDVFIGHDTVIGSPRDDGQVNTEKTIIGEYCKIGKNVEILAGCQIGRYSKIRAGSRIIGDVPAYGLASRAPAILERFACPRCGGTLAVTLVIEQIAELKCQQCGQERIRLSRADQAKYPSHILLPNRGIGKQVSMMSDDLRWLVDWEIR